MHSRVPSGVSAVKNLLSEENVIKLLRRKSGLGAAALDQYFS